MEKFQGQSQEYYRTVEDDELTVETIQPKKANERKAVTVYAVIAVSLVIGLCVAVGTTPINANDQAFPGAVEINGKSVDFMKTTLALSS